LIKIEKNIPLPLRNKFSNINSYKWECLEVLEKLSVGDSIKIEDRTYDTVNTTWLWRVEKRTGFKYKIHSIDHNTQRVWRIS